MEIVISHISALEYWRLAGSHGTPTSHRASRAELPSGPVRGPVPTELGHLSSPLHCLCGSKHKNLPGDVVLHHHQKAALPAGALRAISPRIGIVSPELALAQSANLLSFSELVGLMCEFCGAFSACDEASHGMFSREALSSVRRLRAFGQAAEGIAGIGPFKVAAPYALGGSRSPAETAAALMLSLPRARGGYGLRGVELNRPVRLASRAQKNAGVSRLKPDISWPGTQVCIEYDSDGFHREQGRIANDARRKNALIQSNLYVITLTKLQMAKRFEMDKVAKQAAAKMGKRWRCPDFQKQVKLRNELLGAKSALRRSNELLSRANQQTAPHAGEAR